MSNFKLKATHAPVKAYYETLERFGRGKFDNEGNVRRAFEALLEKCARSYEWMVVPEYQIARTGKNPLRVDAAVLDAFNLPRGYWEAKDEKDDLRAEMNKKFTAGYPRTNILFQKPTEAILCQDGREVFKGKIETAEKLVEVLRLFFEWRQPVHEEWERAVREFQERIPEIAKGAMKLIEGERKTNPAFVASFTAFAELCRESINPDLKDEAVEEMLVQHLLTERIFRRIFDNPEFTRRNVIAAEIEKVIDSLTKRQFSRDTFLRDLDPFYKAIEEAAATAGDYSGKQKFLNKVYETFFQGFSKKQADTHGIVYTPQPIVDFIVRSVEEVLKAEFGKTLGDKDVHILDPFVGTGNFITRIMQEIKTSSLPQKYKEELHCNEVMLLPYYIASMNIEHEYLAKVDEYEPFEGICLVDTFETLGQSSFFNSANTERVVRQSMAPIRIVVGNPPYNMGQDSEEDQNRNRRYTKPGQVDKRIAATYSKDSKATLKNKLGDPYVKAIRWASDRVKDTGIVCFVTNNKFISGIAFDGMRRHLARDFNLILHLNCKGNANTAGERRQREGGNIFNNQIKVGVGITLLLKNPSRTGCLIKIMEVEDYQGAKEKTELLGKYGSFGHMPLQNVKPDQAFNWLEGGNQEDFNALFSLVGKEGIFLSSAPGVNTARDAYLSNYSADILVVQIRKMTKAYLQTLGEYEAERPENIESFTDNHDVRIKWSPLLWRRLKALSKITVAPACIRSYQYRPFAVRTFYQDRFWIERPGMLTKCFPNVDSENLVIALTGNGVTCGFFAIACGLPVDFHLTGDSQCFPFYTYDEDGTNRRENITDWALAEFRAHYGDKKISKWDIFHYTYGLLHHPEYRKRYAANLKRELPRIPMAAEFRRFAEIGAALMKLHIEYEKQKEYPLERRETGKLNWRVEKMALSKDKSQLRYNEFLTLSGIPAEAQEYRLGNRSALEWVVDQYRVSTDARSGIVNDPNREDDPEYIVRLVGQVVTVSVETVRLVREMAGLGIEQV